MEKIRKSMTSLLSSYALSDPRRKAQEFFAFLEQRGELSFEQLPCPPGPYRPKSDACWGVLQKGKRLGIFYYWAEHQSVMYEGRVPGAKVPVNGRVAYADSSQEDIVLYWKEKRYTRARRNGRYDGWTTIPFP